MRGGKWLTENKATCFPTFARRRFLRPGETINDFKEVSDSEKTALEKLRDGWRRPPQSFINIWNEACGPYGRYNEETGYFELNGLTDITYEEAVEIFNGPTISSTSCSHLFKGAKIRTNLPPRTGGVDGITLNYKGQLFSAQLIVSGVPANPMEVLNLEFNDGYFYLSDNKHMIIDQGVASRLKKILGVIGINQMATPKWIKAPYLESIRLRGLFYDLDLSGVPRIDVESIRYLINGKYGSHPSQPTVTVHPDTYSSSLTQIIRSGMPCWILPRKRI